MKRMNLEQVIKVMNLVKKLEELSVQPSANLGDEEGNEMALIIAEIRYELIQLIISTQEWKEVDLMLRR